MTSPKISKLNDNGFLLYPEYNIYVSGPTGGGKTFTIIKLLTHFDEIFVPTEITLDSGEKERIYSSKYTDIYFICHPSSAHQIELFKKQLKNRFTYHMFSDLETFKQHVNSKLFKAYSIVIIDDLMPLYNKGVVMQTLTTHVVINTHHLHLISFICVQDFFAKNAAPLRKNMQALILFKFPNIQSYVEGLRQWVDNKELVIVGDMLSDSINGKAHGNFDITVVRPEQDLAYTRSLFENYKFSIDDSDDLQTFLSPIYRTLTSK